MPESSSDTPGGARAGNLRGMLPWLFLLALLAGLVAPLFDRSLAPIGALVVQLALAGLLILYLLFAGRHWDAGHRTTGVLLLALPAVAYAFAAGRLTSLSDAGVALALAFVVCAVVAGIACMALARVQRLVDGGVDGSGGPSVALAVIALIVVSAIVASWASPSYLGQNLVTVTGELLPVHPSATPSWTPTATTRTTLSTAPATTRTTASTVVPRTTDDWGWSGTPEIEITYVPTTRAPVVGTGGQVFSYTLRGAQGAIALSLDDSVAAALASRQAPFDGNYATYYRVLMDEPSQRPAITALANAIRSSAASPDDQARIAVALVQAIPYDWAAFRSGTVKTRWPYQVLRSDIGVCGEKSVLLAAVLRELGFGVALLKFGPENHMALGVRSPAQFAYRGTGYAFIETTQPTIPTDSDENYVGAGQLVSAPEVFPIAEGRSLNLAEETADLQEFRSIQAMGRVVDDYHYDRWQVLVQKYGLIVGS